MSPPPTDDPLIGATLCGKWTIVRPIGAGGTALVYEARHRNGKLVAVKMLRHELAHKKEARSRFLREGYLANRVGHPGALSVLDDDVDESGRPFLVTELLRGETLDRRWRGAGRRLEADFALGVVGRVLEVLEAAHGAGVVHRDVKPGNVFLADDGAVKLLDFGLARAGPSASTTRSDATLGTPAFMAPEQARGHWGEVDPRSDLWSVGATLYALLGGAYVHARPSGNETLVAAATQRAPSLGLLRPDLPAALVAAVDRALAFDKAERYASAAAMRRALREAAGLPCPAGGEAPAADGRAAAELAPDDERGALSPPPVPASSFPQASRSTRLETEESFAPLLTPSQSAAPTAPPSGRPASRPTPRPKGVLARAFGPFALLVAAAGATFALLRPASRQRTDAIASSPPALAPSTPVIEPPTPGVPPVLASADPAPPHAPRPENVAPPSPARASAGAIDPTGAPARRPRGPAPALVAPRPKNDASALAPAAPPPPRPPEADAPPPATSALRPDAALLDRRK